VPERAMSFYSALVLAANAGLRDPSRHEILELFEELALFDSKKTKDEFGNLANDISELFLDEEAKRQNIHFFCPDSICFATKIEIHGPDGDFIGDGGSIRIHGNGYLFPWNLQALRDRVIRTPKLQCLRHEVQKRFGGRFVFTTQDDPMLSGRWIDGNNGWWESWV
jgi:hypothetical protein